MIKCRQESVKTILKKKFYRQIKLYSLIFIQTAVCLVKDFHRVLFALEEEYAEKLKIVKININFDSELAEKYEVQAAPTLVFFKNGEEISRLRGAVKQAEIKEVIEKSV